MIRAVLKDLGIPKDVFEFMQLADALRQSRGGQGAERLRHRRASARKLRAAKIWDYWERNLDPDLFIDRSLAGRVRNRAVLVTGASFRHRQGDGAQARLGGREGAAGRARRGKAGRNQKEIEAAGRQGVDLRCRCLGACASCDALVARVLQDHGACDYLINNAGRSIRRGIVNSFDRFHDFERTMQLNYFGALRLITGFSAEDDREQARPDHQYLFDRCVVQCAALLGLCRVEIRARFIRGVRGVRIRRQGDQLHDHQHAAGAHADDRADQDVRERADARRPRRPPTLVVEAIVYKPVRIATRLGVAGAVAHCAIAPRLTQTMLNTAFNMFPDPRPRRQEGGGEGQLSAEQMAFAQLTQDTLAGRWPRPLF